MKPPKKRVRLAQDGWYYPQYRCMFFWCHYDKQGWIFDECAVVRYATQDAAMSFLHDVHEEDLRNIKKSKNAKIIEYVRS